MEPGPRADHLAGCTDMRRGPLTYRHDELVRCIQRHVKRLGSSADIEPHGKAREEDQDLRPDLCVHTLNCTYFVEVSILHPLMKSHSRHARQGQPIAYRENQKKAKYEAFMKEQQELHPCKLITVVYDSYGAPGEGVSELESLLVSIAEENGQDHYTARHAVREFQESAALSLQRGNAKALILGVTKSREANMRGGRSRAQRGAGAASRFVTHALGTATVRPGAATSSSLSSASQCSSSTSSSSTSALSSSSSSAPAAAVTALLSSLSLPPRWSLPLPVPSLSLPLPAAELRTGCDVELASLSIPASFFATDGPSVGMLPAMDVAESLTFHPEPDPIRVPDCANSLSVNMQDNEGSDSDVCTTPRISDDARVDLTDTQLLQDLE